MRPVTIAIDGPAASGKSTIGYYLAEQFGYLFVDTGAMYRAVTWAVLENGVAVENAAQVTAIAEQIDIAFAGPGEHDDGRQYSVYVNGRDVTWDLRTAKVEGAVSPVSAYPGVRSALTAHMREIAAQGPVAMVGRDIGTVVIPDADLKLYVTASAEARAQRRYAELQAKGKQISYAAVLAGIEGRDKIDSSRKTAPLKAADDAIVLDTTDMDLPAVFAWMDTIVASYELDLNLTTS